MILGAIRLLAPVARNCAPIQSSIRARRAPRPSHLRDLKVSGHMIWNLSTKVDYHRIRRRDLRGPKQLKPLVPVNHNSDPGSNSSQLELTIRKVIPESYPVSSQHQGLMADRYTRNPQACPSLAWRPAYPRRSDGESAPHHPLSHLYHAGSAGR